MLVARPSQLAKPHLANGPPVMLTMSGIWRQVLLIGLGQCVSDPEQPIASSRRGFSVLKRESDPDV